MLLPFRIEFGDRGIEDLRRRIAEARWPELPFDTGWSAGTDHGVLRDLARYWHADFDWAAAQAAINRRPHVRGPVTDPGGSAEWMHAMVQAGPAAAADEPPRTTLLLIHGGPGSFIEFLEAADRLVAGVDGAPGFDVVVPSLPGYGFSEAPRAPGMHPGRVAERLHALMGELGYPRYGVQGGDWGGHIGARLARAHPEAVVGLHLNFAGGLVPRAQGVAASAEEAAWEGRMVDFRNRQGTYSRLQRTKPQNLGFALHDSPVGLLAWMLEPFHAWTDHGEELWDALDRDTLLTNVTLYWLTGTALSAARLYYEAEHESPPHVPQFCAVPTAFARFPAEPFIAPRQVLERSYRLVQWTEFDRGGHFAALEQPALFAADVSRFFTGLRAPR
ncbi:MAG: epoxide hydrolase [Dehalococcoidia bacterium]|nr:epoxide hydrolase [Dehalococcoidia bacterium]